MRKPTDLRAVVGCAALLLAGLSLGCKGPAVEIAAYPLDGTNGVLTQNGVAFDSAQSSDGNGALRITADEARTVRLFEVDGAGTGGSKLTYSARIRTQDVKGRVYLEMWVVIPGMGEFFSRALESPLSGTVEWTTQQTPFFLREGQDPDRIKLNVVIEGTGTVWIDDLKLHKG